MTERSNKGWKWCLLFLLIYTIGLYFYTTHKLSRIKPIEIERIDTVTVSDTIYEESRDTFYVTKPIPQLIEIIKRDTITKDTILITEQKTYQDTLCTKDNDSILVASTIQGINAQLLSTTVELKKQNQIITNTITIEKYIKPKKIRITPQLGIGYGLLNKQTDIFLGVGLSYNF